VQCNDNMPMEKTRQTQLEIEAQGWCRPNYPQKEAIYLVFMS
jgi:hypothetical protein